MSNDDVDMSSCHSPDMVFVLSRHENLVLDISILLFNNTSWTLSINPSDLVDAMELMETNSRVTSFSSSTYALKNNPMISFLAADVAYSAKITKSTALAIVDMDFSLWWELREPIIESQESEELCAAFLGHVSRYCLITGSLISPDKNLIIFGYNSLTGNCCMLKSA